MLIQRRVMFPLAQLKSCLPYVPAITQNIQEGTEKNSLKLFRLFRFVLIQKKGRERMAKTMHSRASHKHTDSKRATKSTAVFYVFVCVFPLPDPNCFFFYFAFFLKYDKNTPNQLWMSRVCVSGDILYVIFYSIPLNSNSEGQFCIVVLLRLCCDCELILLTFVCGLSFFSSSFFCCG